MGDEALREDLPPIDDIVWMLFEAHYNRRWTQDGDRPPFDPTRADEWTNMAQAVRAMVAEYVQDTEQLVELWRERAEQAATTRNEIQLRYETEMARAIKADSFRPYSTRRRRMSRSTIHKFKCQRCGRMVMRWAHILHCSGAES